MNDMLKINRSFLKSIIYSFKNARPIRASLWLKKHGIPLSMGTYLETSAINTLFDNGINIHSKKWNGLVISPVSISEILMTSNEEKRENLIKYLQILIDSDLIASPSEILIHFIESGCPINEPGWNLVSKTQLNDIGDDLRCNKDKTFIFDMDHLTMMISHYRSISKALNNLCEGKPLPEPFTDFDDFDGILYQLSRIKELEPLSPRELCFYRTCLFLVFILIIAGSGFLFDDKIVENFWLNKAMPDIPDRFHYLFPKYQDILFRGPINEMANMAMTQSISGTNRGLLWDCYHSIYLTYIKNFVTADEHFVEFKSQSSFNPNYEKIMHVKDFINGLVEMYDSNGVKKDR